MRWTLTALLVVAVGCKKAPVETMTKADLGVQHPDLDCPPNTIGKGSPPPAGTEIFCAMVDSGSGNVTKQGPIIGWHNGTRRAFTGSYLNNRKAGQWTYWSVTGTTLKQGSYNADKEDGTWVFYYDNGEKKSEGNFVNGREEGPWNFWTEDGKERSSGTYQFGGRNGKWIDYGPDDQPLRERTYRNGFIVTQRELTKETATPQ